MSRESLPYGNGIEGASRDSRTGVLSWVTRGTVMKAGRRGNGESRVRYGEETLHKRRGYFYYYYYYDDSR